MIQNIIQQSRTKIDKVNATLIVTSDPRTKLFIPEALFTGAVLFLLNRYYAGFLKGFGLDEMAETHGKWAADYLRRLRSGTFSEADLAEGKGRLETQIQLIKNRLPTDSSKAMAESSVEQAMLEAGAVPAQAHDVAVTISEIVETSEHGRD